MKYLIQLIIVFTLCSFSLVFAEFQRIEIPSSPNPVGSGARALGMGGAFIAIADDATAASWNPGGLNQLDFPELSFVYDGTHREENNAFGIHPESDGNESVSLSSVNYFSAVYPFALWNRNLLVSLNYQNLYDFTREWNFPHPTEFQDVYYQQEGRLTALGIACCIQVNLRVSFGFTVNIWDNSLSKNRWEQRIFQQGQGISSENGYTFKEEYRSVDRYAFDGLNVNFNLGMLWNVNNKLTIGAVLKTPFNADLKHDYSYDTYTVYPALPSYNDIKETKTGKSEATLKMPMSYGIGMAYRFSDDVTASLDVYRTEWDEFVLKDSGNEVSPITGKALNESDVDPTIQVRAGFEYLIIGEKYVVPFRGGIFYDPAPAEGGPDNIFGFSAGTGLVVPVNNVLGVKGLVFDVAYQYRFGSDIGDSVLDEWKFSQDLREHKLYSSVIVHF